MGTTANTGQSTWEQIHGGVRETERLIGQKNYNLAMVKARQTLEYMVKCLCQLWKRKTCRHTFRQLRGTPSARLCRRSVF